MIFIILFIALIVFLFYHFYSTSDFTELKKRTKNGVTYTDNLGRLRLVNNDRLVRYEVRNGEKNLYYLNGVMVEPRCIYESIAKFKGEKDYLYERKNGINIYKNIETGEMYSRANFNDRIFIIDYKEDAPMKVLREDDCSKNSSRRKIDIEEMNIVFEDMFDKKVFISSNYFRYAWWRYRTLKWWVGTDLDNNDEIKWQKIITRDNIKTLVPNPNDKWR